MGYGRCLGGTLMPKTNLGAINHQINLSKILIVSFQPLTSDRYLPFPHSNSSIIQQSAQAPGCSQQLLRSRYLLAMRLKQIERL